MVYQANRQSNGIYPLSVALFLGEGKLPISSSASDIFQNLQADAGILQSQSLNGRVKHRADNKPKQTDMQVIERKLREPIQLSDAPRAKHTLSSQIKIDSRAGQSFDDPRPRRIGESTVFTAASIGPKSAMEDRSIATILGVVQAQEQKIVHIPIYAVFDGHGGDQCARFLEKNFPRILQNKFSSIDLKDDVEVYEAVKQAFLEVDARFRGLSPASRCIGSTALVAFRLEGKLWVANVGDSRAVLSKSGEAIQLSQDALATEEPFRSSLGKRGLEGKYLWENAQKMVCSSESPPSEQESEGAEVFSKVVKPNTNPIQTLGPARTIGDGNFQGVSPRPKIKAFPLASLDHEKDNLLILGCDGLWDVVGSKEAVDVLHGVASQKVTPEGKVVHGALELKKEAFRKCSYDNTTVMVVKL